MDTLMEDPVRLPSSGHVMDRKHIVRHLLSSLTAVNVRGKLGGAFGSYGWTGEAVGMIEDRLRGLKLRVPVKGVRVRLIPSALELEECRTFGRDLAGQLAGTHVKQIIDMAALA